MFVFDKEKNRIVKIKPKMFSELGFSERYNLQIWLENNPEAFGEELLVIQKEFDGFDDTRERLDLLAIDKQGNLVVVENKLDDSGRDVTWQVLKYASYCSSLSKHQIKEIYQSYLNKGALNEDSESKLTEFLGVDDFGELQLNRSQRIILVARNFRKEVTSTVLWLLTKYNLKIQCFKIEPYTFDDKVFLNIEQIIPVKEAEEYIIKIAEKAQEEQFEQDEMKERYKKRIAFWKQLLERYNKESTLFESVSPSKAYWISAGSGIGGVVFSFVVGKSYARTEVYCSRPRKAENKFIFDELFNAKEAIERQTGPLEWERLDDKKASRIKQELKDVTIFDENDWPDMIEFLTKSMRGLETAFKMPLQNINTVSKRSFTELGRDESDYV
jgi:hypothetical protein